MCGRFTLDINDRFYPRFSINKAINFQYIKNYNISPSNSSIVIVNNTPKLMTWGIDISFNELKNKKKINIFNSKIESINKSYIYRNINNNRCIIPINGFFEWKKEDNKSIPYYINDNNNEYLALAGIFKDNNFSIITIEANKYINKIHNRMPLILEPFKENNWVNSNSDANSILNFSSNFKPNINEVINMSHNNLLLK